MKNGQLLSISSEKFQPNYKPSEIRKVLNAECKEL